LAHTLLQSSRRAVGNHSGFSMYAYLLSSCDLEAHITIPCNNS